MDGISGAPVERRPAQWRERFDTKAAGKGCFNRRVKPNIKGNAQNHQKAKGGRKRMSNWAGYKNRFGVGDSFAMINRRHLYVEKV